MPTETRQPRVRYLAVIAPDHLHARVRCRSLESDTRLTVGDRLFLDETFLRVHATGDAVGDYDRTLIVTREGPDGKPAH